VFRVFEFVLFGLDLGFRRFATNRGAAVLLAAAE
jgi:hypothetical protein